MGGSKARRSGGSSRARGRSPSGKASRSNSPASKRQNSSPPARRRRRRQRSASSSPQSPPRGRKEKGGRKVRRKRQRSKSNDRSRSSRSRSRSRSRDESEGKGHGKGGDMQGPPGSFPPNMFNPYMMMAGKGGMYPGMFPPMWGNFPGAPGMFPGKGGDMAQSSGNRRKDSRSRSRSRSRDDGPKITEYKSLPKSIMGRVIGKAGATIKKIRDESNARIDAEDRSGEQCSFRIVGTQEQVDIAMRLITEVADKALGTKGGNDDNSDNSTTTSTLEFPITIMGSLIGPKGTKIQHVRNQSGARVSVEKAGEQCKVLFLGTKDQIEKAKEIVKDFAEEELASKEDSSVTQTEHVELPSIATGRIIGPKGATIAEVRVQSGAKVSVEKGELQCRVTLMGTAKQIAKAKQMVQALAEGNEEAAGIGKGKGHVEDSFELAYTLVGRIIGKGGETIVRLQRESGARIEVNTKAGDPCPVLISGEPDKVKHAKQLVMEVVDRWANMPNGGQHGGQHGGQNGGQVQNQWGGPPPPGGMAPPPGSFGWGEPPWQGAPAWGMGMGMGMGSMGSMGMGMGMGTMPPAGDGSARPPHHTPPHRGGQGSSAAAPEIEIDLDEL